MSAKRSDRPKPSSQVLSKRKWLLPLVIASAGLLGWLAFGFFGVQTLFFDNKVSEEGPVFNSGAGASGLESDATNETLADEINEVAEEQNMPTEVDVNEPEPEMGADVVAIAAGAFVDRTHPANGEATVLNDGTLQRFLRFDNFEVDNGPDLNVYLTKADADADASDFGRSGDFVDLGDLKGNIGTQNYEIPANIDLDEFNTVVIWCVRFGVAFAAADLATVG